MSTKLFDAFDGSDSEDLTLGTNKEYAKSYNKFRQKELLKKFKDRGLANSESDSSSGSESSDEDEVLDPKFDEEFFKTLSSLKSKDPSIYDKNTKFFEGLNKGDDEDISDDGNGDNGADTIAKKEKPVTLKDYERNIILEKGGKYEDDSDDEEPIKKTRPASPTAVEAERRIKVELSNVVNAKEDSEDEEFGGIFKKRLKTKEETAKEEEDFAKWLAGKKDDIKDDVKQILEPLKNYWNNSKLPQSERFLRDYILNKGYAETNFADIPTYDEIIGDNEPLSEDEAELEKQAEFEHKYNFRFEEPDAEFITRYPRTIENSVRRTDDKRKQKRQEIKERKKQEKQQKMKELEIVKEMKRKEIEEKIQKLKMVTGNDELGFKDEELEDDFDPDAHDRRMREIFNDDYYQVNEGEEKPECPSDIEELKFEDWDNYDPQRDNSALDGYVDYEQHCEDEDFNMDCDYDPAAAKEQFQKELIESTKGRKSRKGRKNRFMEMIKSEKPAFNPEDEKSYADYIDEYYKMDYEDIIGDVPCRFKYVETTPNDFGLTIEEILLAKNKELNQWASLKKATQIRPDYVEKKEQRLYKMKAKNEDLKRKIFKSLYGEESDDEVEGNENSVGESAKTAAANLETDINNEENPLPLKEKKSKKKRKRKVQSLEVPSNSNIIDNAENVEDNDVVRKKSKLDVESAFEKREQCPNVNNSNNSEKPEQCPNVNNSNNSDVFSKKKKKKNRNRTTQGEKTANETESKTSIPVKLSKNPFKPTVSGNNNIVHRDAVTTDNPKINLKPESSVNTSTNADVNSKNKKKQKKKKNDTIAQSGNQTENKTDPTTSATPLSSTKNPFSAQTHKPNRTNLTKSNKNPFSSTNKNKFKNSTDDKSIKPTPPSLKKGSIAPKIKNKFKNNKKGGFIAGSNVKISDERLKAYGINPKKFHNKLKFGQNKEKQEV